MEEEKDTQNKNNFKDQQVKILSKNSKSSNKSRTVSIPPKTRHVYINFNRYSVLCTGIAVIIVILIYLIPYFLFKQNIISEGIFIFTVVLIVIISIILIYLICNYENSFFISNNRII